MKITVKYLIQQPYMSNVKVLCQESKLGNIVDGVSFLEGNADHFMMLKNTLILSDTASFQRLPKAELEQFLETYSKIKVSAICLKSNTENDSLDALTSLVDKYKIPLLLLPEDTTISSVVSGINFELIYATGYDLTHSYEDNFIQEMIFAEQDTKMMHRRARMMGIRLNEFLGVLMIRPSKNIPILEFTKQCKAAWDSPSLACTRNGLVLLVGRLTVQYELVNKRFCELADDMVKKLHQKYPSCQLTVGVGHCYESVVNLRNSYFNAKTALLAAASLSSPQGIIYYDQLGIYKILFDIKNRPNAYAIRSEIIDPILEYDKEHQTDFYNTICTYLDSFCSVQETAKKMRVHYNTIRYRFQKIKEDLGLDLFQMDTCINLSIGIRLNEFLVDEGPSST